MVAYALIGNTDDPKMDFDLLRDDRGYRLSSAHDRLPDTADRVSVAGAGTPGRVASNVRGEYERFPFARYLDQAWRSPASSRCHDLGVGKNPPFKDGWQVVAALSGTYANGKNDFNAGSPSRSQGA